MAAGDVTLSTTEYLVHATVVGASLHSCAYIPFGRLDNPADWLPAQDFNDMKLKLTGEASAGAVKVLTQQLRT